MSYRYRFTVDVTPKTVQAPEGQGWTRRTPHGKWHLIERPGGEYRCRRTGSPKPTCCAAREIALRTIALRLRFVCRYCVGLAGYDPDTGERWAQP